LFGAKAFRLIGHYYFFGGAVAEKKLEVKKRKARNYPAWTFEQALTLPEAINRIASGEKVSRLTLFKALDKSPTSSASQNLITNSSKYNLTKGSFSAEYLELTTQGRILTEGSNTKIEKFEVAFDCAVKSIPIFQTLYETYKGKKLPAHEVFADTVREQDPGIEDPRECIDIFVVNCRYLGLLQSIAGAETLVSEDTRRDELRRESPTIDVAVGNLGGSTFHLQTESDLSKVGDKATSWDEKCFYITPIGEDGSPERRHSDLFLNYLVEPALRSLKMTVVRADMIGNAGLITSQILEHILKCRLCIVDLSFHNPNVFYEMAIRHASNRPIVQIARKRDRLPFDVGQVRTVIIDDSDVYAMIPNIEFYRSEIATQAKGALDGQSSNPISIFFPGTHFEMKKNI
jgi:hypothetical protein